MKRTFAVLLLMVLPIVPVTKATTCQVTLSNVVDNAVFGGSAMAGGVTQTGGGNGPGWPSNIITNVWGGWNQDSVSLTSGNFSITTELKSLSGGTEPGAEILVIDETNHYYVFGFQTIGGTLYLKFDDYVDSYQCTAHGCGYYFTRTNHYSAVQSAPLYLRLDMVNGTYNAYTSTNGTSWGSPVVSVKGLALSYFTAGLIAFAGDTNSGSIATATWGSFNINGNVIPLTDADQSNTGNNVGSGSSQIQAGTITVGPDSPISGTVTVPTSCSTSWTLVAFNDVKIVDSNNNVILNSGEAGSFSESCAPLQCDGTATFSGSNPQTGSYQGTLVHGTVYTFTSTTLADTSVGQVSQTLTIMLYP